MAFVLNDRVLESSTTTGTGPFTLAGAASSFQSFSAGIGANNTTYYAIANTNASEWEVGLGTLDATGLILTRTTVYRSSNSNNAVSFTAGTKTVFCTYPSTRSVNLDTAGVLALTTTETITTATNSPLTVNNGGTGTALANSVASFFGNVDSYSQVNYQNLSAGNSASTDFVATADNGSDTTNYVDFGINSSTYNLGTFTIAGINDGYMYSQSTNLAIGVATVGKSVKFFQGGTLAANEVARFAPTTNNFLVGTTSDGSGTSKLRVDGVIETTSGIKFPTGSNQTTPFAVTNTLVNFGTVLPVQSYNYTFADVNATTTSKVSMAPNPASSNSLLAVGTVTGGSSYNNNTYYNVALTGTQTVTITIAAPGVFTLTNALPNNTAVTLSTTGALPTGLTAGTTYYVVNSTGASLTCSLSATLGGTGITTSGTQSGVHSMVSTTGTGAVASQIIVSGNAVTTVSMPTAAGAVVNGTITGGTTYPNGTYYNVPLTGGAGINAVATSITVSGNAVTAVVLPVTGVGYGYAITNTLSASNTFLGGAGSGFVYTVSAVSSFGTGYSYGDVLFAANTNLGGSGSGFSIPVSLLSSGGDELEMDGIKVSAYCATNGLITVYFDASPGYIAGGRTFAYTLG